MPDAEIHFANLAADRNAPHALTRSLLDQFFKMSTSPESRIQLLQRILTRRDLPAEARFLVLLVAAVLGDVNAERETISELSRVGFEHVRIWLLQASRFGEETVRAGGNAIKRREFTATEFLDLIGTANFGLSYKTEVLGLDVLAGSESSPHPARIHTLNALRSCLSEGNRSIEALTILAEAGDDLARGQILSAIQDVLDSTEGTMEHEVDNGISNALHIISKDTVISTDLLFRIVDKSTSNAGSQAVRLLTYQGDESVLTTLVERYNGRVKHDFVRSALFSGIERLSARYGRRIIRDKRNLRIDV